MAEFFAELRRRHIYRVGAAYVVVAWAIAQGIGLLSQIFQLPGSITQPAVVLLVAGFPVALAAAWMIESKAHQAVASAVRSKPTVVDWTLCGALAVVLLFMGYQQIAPPSRATQQAGVDAAKQAAASERAGISLAVLPFANLSGDPSQEFFSDGLTEEVTSALAKVPGLKIVARTSAFEFKGQNRDIRAMGEQLGATHLIEGSVRKANDRVRITMQLIKADDGTHIWAEDYNRLLTDIFATQEDIARAVAAALRVPLGLKPGENLVSNRNIDPDNYELFLRGKAFIDARGLDNFVDAARMFEQVVARSPDYAPAWALLCVAYYVIAATRDNEDRPVDEVRGIVSEWLRKADTALQRAVALDPNDPFSLGVSGNVTWSTGNPLQGESLALKAIALTPEESGMLWNYGYRLNGVGRLKEALPLLVKAHELEPLLPGQAASLFQILWVMGMNEEAIALAKTLRPNQRANFLASIYASMGRFGEAADALMEFEPGGAGAAVAAQREAIRLLRLAPARVSAQDISRFPAAVDFVYLHQGTPEPVVERILKQLERQLAIGLIEGPLLRTMWHPAYAPVRKTERFKAFVRKAGYVDYWRAKGWPELCQPVGADDFACS